MKWFYAPEYDYGRNLPQHRQVHGFVLDKPTRIYRHLVTADVFPDGEPRSAPPVVEEEVAAIHEPGVLIDSALTRLCADGWVSGTACRSHRITYETTDMGRGWFHFHHHHLHISVSRP